MRLKDKLIEPLAWYLPKIGIVLKPRVVQFPVNDICNARCQMCNIWQQKLAYQISSEELAKILRDPLFSEVRVVGINGGEPTIRKDLSDLARTLFKGLPRLEQISLITNGLVAKKVIGSIEALQQVTREYGGKLSVMVSLDGYEGTHDRVRGRIGNYTNAIKVIEAVQERQLGDQLVLGCTVIKENVYGLFELHEEAVRRDIYIKYRVGIPHQRLYSQDVTDPFNLDEDERYHLCNFIGGIVANYEKSDKQKFFYRSLIDQVAHRSPRKAGCDWQFRGVTITANSRLLYCAVKSPDLGDLRKEKATTLFRNGRKSLVKIVADDCGSCMHDYVGPLPLPLVARTMLKNGVRRVLSGSGNSVYKHTREALETVAYASRKRKMQTVGIRGKPGSKNGRGHALVCGWYGTETIGDMGILGGIVGVLKRFCRSISVASLNTPLSNHTRRNNTTLEGISVLDLYGDCYHLEDFDLLVFGGGPIMAIDNLAEIEALVGNARKLGIPFVIAGCGVGPFGHDARNRSIGNILNHANFRIYRDEESRQAAGQLIVLGGYDIVAEDPAFGWAIAENAKQLSSDLVPVQGGRLRVAMGMREWPYWEYAKHYGKNEAREVNEKLEECVAHTLGELAQRFALEIIPISMCENHIGGDDRWYYQRFFRKYRELADLAVVDFLGREKNLEETYQLIRTSGLMISMRYHSLVLSLAAAVPVVAIDYTEGRGKVKALCRQMGVPSASISAMNKDSFLAMCLDQIKSSQSPGDAGMIAELEFERAFSSVLGSVMSRDENSPG